MAPSPADFGVGGGTSLGPVAVGTTKTTNGITYRWDGSKWVKITSAPSAAGGGGTSSGATITPVPLPNNYGTNQYPNAPGAGADANATISTPVPASTVFPNTPKVDVGGTTGGGGGGGAADDDTGTWAIAPDTAADEVKFPEMPDVGAPFDVELPTTDTGAIGDAFGNIGAAVGAVEGPNVDDIYGDVQGPDNLGGQMAGYYDNIGYQQNDDSINKLYDDMMKLMDWDTAKGEVLREGSAGNRAMMAANAASGRGLGGSFISGQAQADINTQGNLMAKKENFLNNLVAIQQNRAQALATEHQLGQQFGIDIAKTQAGIKADEDKAIRDAEYNLELTKAAAELGVEETRYTALVNAIAAGETAKAQAIANELSKQTDRAADLIIAKATAQSNLIGQDYGRRSDMAVTAATTEPALLDISTQTGVNVQVDPKTNIGTFTGSDGQKHTLSSAAVTTMQQGTFQIKMDEGIADVRTEVTEWASKHPNATKQEILNKAGELMYQGLIDMLTAKDAREGKQATPQRKTDIVNWAKAHMAGAFGETWATNFTGIIKDPKYKVATTPTAVAA